MMTLLPSLRRATLLVPALLGSLAALAQNEPIKFGKPDPKDLTAAPFAADSAAGAVVLCDYGSSRIVLNGTKFQVVFDRVTRIKILKKSGYDAATVQVGLYHRNSNEEKFTALRGFTYNMVNGQLQKTKLETGNTFTEQLTPNVSVRKFTLPDVREGSVIEYAYSITSDFLFNFQDWTFQRDIPVRWSEYRAAIPEYFDYKMVLQGYEELAVNSKEENTEQYTAKWEGGGVGAGGKKEYDAGTQSMVARITNYRWAMQNVPPLRDEPYITTPNDYVARFDFELVGEKLPGQPYHGVTTSWEKINQDLLQDENFGQQLDRAGFLKEAMQALVAKYPALPERAAAVREFVMSTVRYDGTNRATTTAPLRRAYDAHRGSAADVNLLLIAALRQAGIPAQPVLLSTRDHGRVSRDFPLLERFNYVVAQVALPDGKDLLVDATEPLLPCGVLPERCLNQTGRLVAPRAEEARWVELNPNQRHVRFQQINLTLDEHGGLNGKVHEEHGGYAGASRRSELLSQGEKKFQTELSSRHEGWALSSFAVAERDAVHKPLVLDYSLSLPAPQDKPLGQLYLSPLSYFAPGQNPFKHENRAYPVDFGTTQDETTLLTLTLPAGYELAELPKSAVVDLPDGGGRFLFNAVSSGNTVQLTSRLNLRKPVYSAEEYGQLREFYRLMLEKQAEKLTVKRKA